MQTKRSAAAATFLDGLLAFGGGRRVAGGGWLSGSRRSPARCMLHASSYMIAMCLSGHRLPPDLPLWPVSCGLLAS